MSEHKKNIMDELFSRLTDTDKLFSFFVLVLFNLLSVLASIVELIKGIFNGKMVMVQVKGDYLPVNEIPLYLFVLITSVIASLLIIHFNRLMNKFFERKDK